MKTESNQELDFLGKEVVVEIDRQLGSLHPNYHFKYELNYGFIPNTLAGDGKEIDAYIFGVDESIEKFEGVVKAVIIRNDDNENKLVVSKLDYPLIENEIRQKTYFQEQYFDTKIIML